MDYIPKEKGNKSLRGVVNKRGAKTIRTRNKKRRGGGLRVIVQPTLNGLVIVKGKLRSGHHRERAQGLFARGTNFQPKKGRRTGVGRGKLAVPKGRRGRLSDRYLCV